MKLQVVGGLAVEDGKVLCILHRGRGGWEMPGGKRKEGESLQDALRREYLEETGREIDEVLETVSYEPDRVAPDGTPFELTISRVTLKPGENVPGPEAREVAWQPPEAIRDGSLPNDYAPALAAVAMAEITRDFGRIDAEGFLDPLPIRMILAQRMTAALRRSLGGGTMWAAAILCPNQPNPLTFYAARTYAGLVATAGCAFGAGDVTPGTRALGLGVLIPQEAREAEFVAAVCASHTAARAEVRASKE